MNFFGDRAAYVFAHPVQGRIEMTMYYRDMRLPLIIREEQSLTFKIKRPLRHFVDDYDAEDHRHRLRLVFKSDADLTQFESEVWPLIAEVSS